MHTCYVNPADWSEKAPVLSGDEEHHLVRVCRAQDGERVKIIDGRGRSLSAIVRLGERDRSGLRLDVAEIFQLRTPAPHVTLLQAIPKGDRMEGIIEKITELGVAQIIPVISERVIKRTGAGSRGVERWRKIALESAKQCGAAWVPDVCDPCTLDAAIRKCGKHDVFFVGSLRDGAVPLKDALSGRSGIERAMYLIGPEGDLTEAEIDMAVKAGAVEVHFGPHVLRTDTAAIFGMAAICYEYALKKIPAPSICLK
jgi:16S rRNA (uracil1498-N3)-methyltransferase